jgi:hypothetical protein
MKGNKKFYALGRLKRGEMNKLEAEFAQALEARKRAGEVLDWQFESHKFRLADMTWYTPDFGVMLSNRNFVLYEVKGYFMDDAKVKLKVAADRHPFPFFLVRKKAKKDGGDWSIEQVGGGGGENDEDSTTGA